MPDAQNPAPRASVAISQRSPRALVALCCLLCAACLAAAVSDGCTSARAGSRKLMNSLWSRTAATEVVPRHAHHVAAVPVPVGCMLQRVCLLLLCSARRARAGATDLGGHKCSRCRCVLPQPRPCVGPPQGDACPAAQPTRRGARPHTRPGPARGTPRRESHGRAEACRGPAGSGEVQRGSAPWCALRASGGAVWSRVSAGPSRPIRAARDQRERRAVWPRRRACGWFERVDVSPNSCM